MRVFGVVSFLVFLVVPVLLFAQQQSNTNGSGSSASSSSISTEFGESYGGVQNVSAQAAGTFIGGGRPDAFVGTTEIYSSNSNSSRSSSTNTARRTATTTRTTARTATTTARRATTAAAGTTPTGSANNQLIRSATSVDFDADMPTRRVQPAAIEVYLNRVRGIQDSQVTFRSSPLGTTAVLTGTVASERERRLAHQLLLLEPGINRVDNLLEIR